MSTSRILVITGPSGAGKSTLVRELLLADSHLRLSISYTSRPPRAGETDGQHYHFITKAAFEASIAQSEFIEHATIYGYYYGTSGPWMRQQLSQATHDILLEIDYQGLAQVRQAFPEAVSILILPPNLSVLRARLTRRNTDSKDSCSHRLASAQGEIKALSCCQYLVVNHTITQAVQDLMHIVAAERLTMARNQDQLALFYEATTTSQSSSNDAPER